MCGRYELHSHPAAIALAFGLAQAPNIEPHYNIAPSTDVPIVRIDPEGLRELLLVRWGLVPRWARDPSIGHRLINARGETVATKASFQMPYRRHRCLLPADGFYEWMSLPPLAGGRRMPRKQPVLVGLKSGGLFGMAGLYERWRQASGEVVDSCTIVTTEANALLREVHDRMPVIVAPEHFERWLDPANAEVDDLIAPYPSAAMTWQTVSTRVNDVHHDDAALIEHAPAARDEAEEQAEPTSTPAQQSLF